MLNTSPAPRGQLWHNVGCRSGDRGRAKSAAADRVSESSTGDRGTGKSTTIRALADLLPAIEVVEGDPFNSSPDDSDLMSDEICQKIEQQLDLKITQKKVPMVDLPLGATQDRVCGTIDIEKALYEWRVKIAQICAELDMDGLWGDIVSNRAAKALAAFEGRREMSVDNIRRVMPLCLRHRLRKDPLETVDSGEKVQKIASSNVT